MKIKCRFLLLLLFIASLTFAQTGKGQWNTVSSNGYTYKTVIGDPMKARFYVLKNGLTVILVSKKKNPAYNH